MTFGAWFVIAFLCTIAACVIAALEEWTCDRRRHREARERTRADFDHHVNTAPGFTLEEQIAAFPGEVERMVRREVAG